MRRSLEAIHEHPGEPWTVAGLARVAGLSRAAFARRFSEEAGCPPMGYLARWRMTVAAELLRISNQPLTAIATEVGYENHYAFATAFKRLVGESPGRYRSRRRSDQRNDNKGDSFTD